MQKNLWRSNQFSDSDAAHVTAALHKICWIPVFGGITMLCTVRNATPKSLKEGTKVVNPILNRPDLSKEHFGKITVYWLDFRSQRQQNHTRTFQNTHNPFTPHGKALGVLRGAQRFENLTF